MRAGTAPARPTGTAIRPTPTARSATATRTGTSSSLFRAEGATNVTFFFHADTYFPQPFWNTLEVYYPGDAYVDWVGISDYGSLDPRVPISPFARKIDVSGVYRTLTKISRRPMAVVEMGTVDNAAGEKPAWIQGAFSALRSGRYPRIRGATWWNMDSGANTRIDTSPASLEAFRAGVAGDVLRGAAAVHRGLPPSGAGGVDGAPRPGRLGARALEPRRRRLVV